MVMACVLLPACAGDEGKGTTVPTDRIIHPWLSSSPGFNARSGATGSKVTPKEDNRVNEATAAQEPSDGFPLPPADELKGTTVRVNGAASPPAVSPSPGFKVADGTVIARDESMKVVRFLGDNLSTIDCLLLTSDLVLRSNGTAAFITNILGLGTTLTYHFSFEVYDHRRNLLFKTPNLSHEISSKEYLIDEVNHKIAFDMSQFAKVEHVNITFQCKRVGFDNPSADARSGATAVIAKGEGNRNQDASQRLPWTLARTPQPPPPEPSSPKPLAPVVQPVTGEPVGSTTAEPKLININTASADDLNRLGVHFGKAIIAARPYRSIGELVSKRVLKRSTFFRIKDRITVAINDAVGAPHSDRRSWKQAAPR